MVQKHDVATLDEIRALRSAHTTSVFLIYFGARWCQPCATFKATFETFVNHLDDSEADCVVVRVNRDSEESEAIFEEFLVTKMPTIVMLGHLNKMSKLERPDLDALLNSFSQVSSLPELELNAEF